MVEPLSMGMPDLRRVHSAGDRVEVTVYPC